MRNLSELRTLINKIDDNADFKGVEFKNAIEAILDYCEFEIKCAENLEMFRGWIVHKELQRGE